MPIVSGGNHWCSRDQLQSNPKILPSGHVRMDQINLLFIDQTADLPELVQRILSHRGFDDLYFCRIEIARHP